MSPRPTTAVVALSLVASLSLTACGDAKKDGPATGAEPLRVPVGTAAYDLNAPTWLQAGEVHIGDEAFPTPPGSQTYVVTEKAIYYGTDDGLYMFDGGEPEQFSTSSWPGLEVSADGRYLGLIDNEHGPFDEFDTSAAVPTVVDLSTGKTVLRIEPGSLKGEDLGALYSELPPYVAGFIGEDVVVSDPMQDPTEQSFPLNGGDPTPIEEDEFGSADYPEFRDHLGWSTGVVEEEDGSIRLPKPGEARTYTGHLSPDKKWLFKGSGTFGPAFYDAATGAEKRLRGAEAFELGGWIDDDTFYASAGRVGGINVARGPFQMVECEIASLTCTPLSSKEPFADDGTAAFIFATGHDPLAYY